MIADKVKIGLVIAAIFAGVQVSIVTFKSFPRYEYHQKGASTLAFDRWTGETKSTIKVVAVKPVQIQNEPLREYQPKPYRGPLRNGYKQELDIFED